MTIYSLVTGNSFEEIEKEFAGKGYGDFKAAVGEAVADHLEPIRTRFAQYSADKAYLAQIYTQGAEKAYSISRRTLDKAVQRLGFVKR